ncbi:MAG: DUF2892 domain-containing protein [Myxococcales bacterium]|nr:DUF2892 domain-containing protein [Myxococcales bacterium]
MSIDRIVLVFAAVVILTGTALAATVSPWFLVMPAFVGLNLLQAQFTGFCPLAKVLGACGCERGSLFR